MKRRKPSVSSVATVKTRSFPEKYGKIHFLQSLVFWRQNYGDDRIKSSTWKLRHLKSQIFWLQLKDIHRIVYIVLSLNISIEIPTSVNHVPCKPQTNVNMLVTVWFSSLNLCLKLGTTTVVLIWFKNRSIVSKTGSIISSLLGQNNSHKPLGHFQWPWVVKCEVWQRVNQIQIYTIV